ncbi:MAG: ABC transporter permease [Methanobacteriota archaeon]|nr:MAG: ABC transporter permease [Euryarchaeota archaeon]
MNSTMNILRKEIREMLTKSTILPVVLLALLFGGMGSMIGGVEEQVSRPPIVGVINNDGDGLSLLAETTISERAEVVYDGSSVEEGITAVDDAGGVALLQIPDDFTESIYNDEPGTIRIFWIMEGTGLLDSVPSSAVENVLWYVNRDISVQLIEMNSTANASFALNPTARDETTILGDREMDGISPGTIASLLSPQSLMMPIVIMMLIMAAGGTVISSMGMEKENKTLETLLTLPVKRGSIVTGKLAASAVVGLLMAAIYMVGMSYYMGSLGTSSDLDLAQFDLTLSAIDYAIVGASLFITLLAALALCMVLGTFAKNYKSAQTLTMPIVIMAMVPMFLLMFKDFGTLPLPAQLLVFAIPFSHPMMAMRGLMFDDYALVVGGLLYVSAFAIAMMAVTIWIFKTDRLLTGRIGKKVEGRRMGRFPILEFLLGHRRDS